MEGNELLHNIWRCMLVELEPNNSYNLECLIFLDCFAKEFSFLSWILLMNVTEFEVLLIVLVLSSVYVFRYEVNFTAKIQFNIIFKMFFSSNCISVCKAIELIESTISHNSHSSVIQNPETHIS